MRMRYINPHLTLLTAVQASAKTGVIFKQIRTLLDGLLQQKLEDPSLNLTGQHLTGSCCGDYQQAYQRGVIYPYPR